MVTTGDGEATADGRHGAETGAGYRLLVLGIGNTNCADDGIGSLLAERLAQTELGADSRVEIVDGGTVGLGLLYLFDRCTDLVVLDAVDLGEAPGTVFHFTPDEVLAPELRQQVSFHQSGLNDLLAAGHLMGALPQHVTVLGIQVGAVSYSTDLSPELGARVDEVERAVLAWVKARLDSRA